MSAAWLTAPIQLDGSRMFMCDEMMSAEDCEWYQHRWHFWYIADWVFALPTVAFFMCSIGIFIIGHVLSSHVLGYRRFRGPPIWQKLNAVVRYLSYRGFYLKSLRWNSAPLGILLLGAAGTIFFFCMVLAPGVYYWPSEMFGGSPALATRSGWLALACMPFVFATATKTNWITLVTGVSHEKLQVFHRWIAYAFFVLSLLHTFPFIVWHVRWHDMQEHFSSSLIFYWTGIVAIIFQAWLTFGSFSTIRNLGYEFFKAMHLFAAVIFILMLFFHCDYTLTSWDYFIATAAIYVPCYVYPWARTYFEYGGTQQARISIEDNGFTKITIPAKFTWKPGHHAFLRFTSFGFLNSVSAHPFTICSLPAVNEGEESELVFYIRHQKGFTKKLYQMALEQPGAMVSVQVDGPYGGINEQRFYEGDRLLVVAGGSGAGWILPFIEAFVRNSFLPSTTSSSSSSSSDIEKAVSPASSDVKTPHSQPTTPTPRASHTGSGPLSLRVILATRDISSRIWFLRTVSELLERYPASASSLINIQVFLTGEAASDANLPQHTSTTSSKNSTSSTNKNTIPEIGLAGEEIHVPGKEFEGRPKLAEVVREEARRARGEGGDGELSVFVCGPTTMLNDVRNAVAGENLGVIQGKGRGGVYLHCEHFSWA